MLFTIQIDEDNLPHAADIVAETYFAGQDGIECNFSGALMSILLALDLKEVK